MFDWIIDQDEILSLMAGLELTPNMSELIRRSVEELGATVIIISDSNTEFIEHILKERNLRQMVDKVFTNPANWNSEGKLFIQPYHHQVQFNLIIRRLQETNLFLQETCKLSTKNLCKGQIMEDYLQTCGKDFSLICYVGDGRNDFCPSLRLSDRDLTCVR